MKRFTAIIIVITLAIFILSSCELKSPMTGYCLISSGGDYMIITSNSRAIVMSNISDDETLFDNLQTGDKIRITYDAIAQSYPGQTGAYSCKILKKGSIENIPQEAYDKLKEYGWITE
jgi:hypothetical protein